MLKNLLKVAIRNVRKEKFFSVLNITGLAIGTCCVIFISLYIADELSFDKFHTKADRIYRINQTFIWGDDSNLFGSTGPAVAEALRVEIPEFEEVTRIHTVGNLPVSYEKRKPFTVFEEEGVLAVDDNFFKVFTFPTDAGDLNSMLSEPYSVVLTKAASDKYFGGQEPIGEFLWMGEKDQRKAYRITGVLRDVPENSHIDFDMLISMSSIPRVSQTNWSWIWTTFVTFGVLDDNVDPVKINLAERLEEVPRKHAGVSLKRLQNITFEEWEADGKEWKLYAQPLTDIHLYSSNVYSRLNSISDIKMVYIFGTIGVLIFVMCLVNFINLTTARSFNRSKEIGIRKVVGSSRRGLMFQFLVESVLISALAILLGAFLTEWLMPLFNDLAGKNLSMDLLNRPVFLFALIASPLITGILAGLYPAFVMTTFSTVKALKSKIGVEGGKGNLRNALVVVQFTVSIVFIASTVIVFNQLSYQKNLDLGFDRNNKLIVNRVDRLDTSMESFRAMTEEMRGVRTVSVSDATPPSIYNHDNFSLKGSERSEFPLNYITADKDFTGTYGLEVVAGRNFREGLSDVNRGLVNEATVRFLGLTDNEEMIGRKLDYYGNEFEVIGVVKDFNTSFNAQLRPFAIFYENSELFSAGELFLSIAFHEDLSAEELQQMITDLEQKWAQLEVKSSFSYSFLDQKYETIYRPTLLFGQILSTFSVLTVIIAVLGIIGLITFMIEKRGKEIGIRKVLGASVAQVFLLLSGRLGILLLIAFVLSVPVVWYGMDIWLQDFVKRRPLQIWDFVLGGALMLVITFLATSLQTFRASSSNPVDILKDE